MKIIHHSLPRGPVSHLGGVHNPNVTPQQDQPPQQQQPAQSDIASQIAAITSQKAGV